MLLGKLNQGGERQLTNTLIGIASQYKNWPQFDDPKMIETVPISALRQNFRDKKYIQTLMDMGRNLHPLTEYVNRRGSTP
jgi:hypothetical protein